ncbi:ATH1, acid trehalase-like protein, partial [mine drainage metagenome]
TIWRRSIVTGCVYTAGRSIRAVARFWTSRVTWNARRHRYDILHVNSVAESASDIPDDTYTNLGAAEALRIADQAARVLGVRPDPRWGRIAHGLYIPMAPGGTHYLPFGAAKPGGKDFGAGPLPLLFLPALDVRMPAALRRGTYDYADRSASPAASAASVWGSCRGCRARSRRGRAARPRAGGCSC